MLPMFGIRQEGADQQLDGCGCTEVVIAERCREPAGDGAGQVTDDQCCGWVRLARNSDPMAAMAFASSTAAARGKTTRSSI